MKALALALLAAVFLSPLASALILVRIPGIPGDATLRGYDGGDWFVAESLGFGVDRNLELVRGGTEETNIGVGELELVTISKSLSRASAKLMQLAINGNSSASAEIRFLQTGGAAGEVPIVFAIYKLDRCFVKSWSTSGDADGRPTEEVSFYYSRIAFQYYHSVDGVTFVDGGLFSWDAVMNRTWDAHNLPKSPPRDGR